MVGGGGLSLADQLYGAFLRLRGKKCVVIGGGRVAERKVRSLLPCEARVTVIAPHLTAWLQEKAAENQILHLARPYQPGDVKDAFFVIAATPSPEVNRAVAEEADACGRLVNVVNQPERCNLMVPSMVRRGPLQIAISTSGLSPAVARRLRGELERLIGPEYLQFLQWMAEARQRLKRTVADEERRGEIMRRLVQSDVLSLLREGDRHEAERRMAEIIEGRRER